MDYLYYTSIITKQNKINYLIHNNITSYNHIFDIDRYFNILIVTNSVDTLCTKLFKHAFEYLYLYDEIINKYGLSHEFYPYLGDIISIQSLRKEEMEDEVIISPDIYEIVYNDTIYFKHSDIVEMLAIPNEFKLYVGFIVNYIYLMENINYDRLIDIYEFDILNVDIGEHSFERVLTLKYDDINNLCIDDANLNIKFCKNKAFWQKYIIKNNIDILDAIEFDRILILTQYIDMYDINITLATELLQHAIDNVSIKSIILLIDTYQTYEYIDITPIKYNNIINIVVHDTNFENIDDIFADLLSYHQYDAILSMVKNNPNITYSKDIAADLLLVSIHYFEDCDRTELNELILKDKKFLSVIDQY